MAQSTDYLIDNQTAAQVRSELNNILAAVSSQNSGSTAPTTTYPFMSWVDTSSSPPILRMRNGANTAWTYIGPVETTSFGLVSAINPSLSGTVTVPTVSATDNTTKAASTAHVSTKIATHGSWIAPTLLNGWANVSPMTTNYRLNNNNYVQLRGTIQKNNPGTIENAFQLPTGYRPIQEVSRYYATTAGGFGRVFIDTSGNVFVAFTSAPSGVIYANLDMIFPVS